MAIDWFPLWLSLRVALLATAIATVGGLAMAYLLANRDFRGKETLDAALTLPLVLPPTEDIKADEFQAMLIVAGGEGPGGGEKLPGLGGHGAG